LRYELFALEAVLEAYADTVFGIRMLRLIDLIRTVLAKQQLHINLARSIIAEAETLRGRPPRH